jgi:hypothetical protein
MLAEEENEDDIKHKVVTITARSLRVKFGAKPVKKEAPEDLRPKGGSIGSRRKKENPSPKKKEKKIFRGLPELTIAQDLLDQNVAIHFQKHFSKFIRVTDIPRIEDVHKIDASTLRAG